jgi:hypothetical protein
MCVSRRLCCPVAERRSKAVRRHIAAAHVPKRVEERHARNLEYLFAVARQALQDFECSRRQWDAVFALGFHPRRRNGPCLGRQVEFTPARGKDLAGARRGQDGEFEGSRPHLLTLAQLGHERRQVGPRDRRVMLDGADLSRGGQQLVEMAAPSRRVNALAKAADGCPIEHGLDWLVIEARPTVSALRCFHTSSSGFRSGE